MRKLVNAVLCGVMCLALTACGLGVGKPKWVSEAEKTMSSDIRSGEIMLAGELYTFPMTLQDLLDDGWFVSGSYENAKEFVLEPEYESSDFELFNEGDGYLSVCVYNDGTEDAHIEDCTVSWLSFSTTEEDIPVVLPGGIYKDSKPADITKAYGEADATDKGSETVEYMYEYKDAQNRVSEVTLLVYDNSYTQEPLTRVEYYFASYEE